MTVEITISYKISYSDMISWVFFTTNQCKINDVYQIGTKVIKVWDLEKNMNWYLFTFKTDRLKPIY